MQSVTIKAMSSNQFLVFNGFVVLLLVVWFLLLFSKKSQPSKLNLRKGNGPLPKEGALDIGGEEELNVLFNFNGHLWDAYEVLGVPAGSSPDQVRRAYEEALDRLDPSSKTLVEMAFQSIEERMRSSV